MKLYIDTDTNNILIDINIKNSALSCFTEYKMNFSEIPLHKINDSIKNSNKTYKSILLLPMTHINNIWHLMHHIFIIYKYVKKKNIECDMIYHIFFDTFYKRQGNITECQYNDLIFKGLGFDYNKFKNNYEIFKNNEYIGVSEIYYVNEGINFRNEPLFDDFKNSVLNNFNIEYKNNNSKNITFILRNGTREITNIDYVKDNLLSYNINYVYLENRSVEEQLEIIANTDILIGVHGAGLSWCVFMKNCSTLLEMYPGNSNTDNYIKWCKIAKINYKRLPINITTGNVHKFRNATVNINDNQLQYIKTIIQ